MLGPTWKMALISVEGEIYQEVGCLFGMSCPRLSWLIRRKLHKKDFLIIWQELIKTETESLSFDFYKRNYDANQRYYLKIINARTEKEIDSREVLLDLPEMEYWVGDIWCE